MTPATLLQPGTPLPLVEAAIQRTVRLLMSEGLNPQQSTAKAYAQAEVATGRLLNKPPPTTQQEPTGTYQQELDRLTAQEQDNTPAE